MKNQVYFPFSQSFVGDVELISPKQKPEPSKLQPIETNIHESPNVNYTSTKQSKYTTSALPLNNSTFYSNNNNNFPVVSHHQKNRASFTSNNFYEAIQSPTSSPLVIAMGRLQQQSQQQMRKFRMIQDTASSHKTDLSPLKVQRESHSMMVETKKSKSSSKKYHAAGFTINNGVIIAKNHETDVQKVQRELGINNYPKNQQPSDHSWNINMKRRNLIANKNVYNHKPSNSIKEEKVLPSIQKGLDNVRVNLRNEIKITQNYNMSQDKQMKSQSNMSTIKRYNTNEMSKNQTLAQSNEYSDPPQQQKPSTVLPQKQRANSNFINTPGFSQQALSVHYNVNKSIQNAEATFGKGNQIFNKSFNSKNQDQSNLQSQAINKSFSQGKYINKNQKPKFNLLPSFQKPDKTVFNVETDVKKLQKLQNPDLNEEQKAELIYKILKEQLRKSRKELMNIRKLRQEQEKSLNNTQNLKDQDLLKKKQKIEDTIDKSLSPQLRRVIKNLTSHRHTNKYCKHCRIFDNPEQYVNNSGLAGYDANNLLEFMNRIKLMNQKLYQNEGKYLNETKQVKNLVSLKNIGQGDYDYSRNDQSLVNINTTTANKTKDQKDDKSCFSGSSGKKNHSKLAQDRLLENYDKRRHICSTSHFFDGPYSHAQKTNSARRPRRNQREPLEMVKLEIRPCSEQRSFRDACVSAINLSVRDMSMQMDAKSEHEQMIQTFIERDSFQMQTHVVNQDACIETDPVIKIDLPSKGYRGIMTFKMEQNTISTTENQNYEWTNSGLYSLIQTQYKRNKSKFGAGAYKNFNINQNEESQMENMQDAHSQSNFQKEKDIYQEEISNLNPNNLDIFKEVEVLYIASLLKKKGQNNPEQLTQIHSKAKTTLSVLTKNLISGDVTLESIFNFYEEPKRENIIRLLLRCKKMYDVRTHVKKILYLIMAQQELFLQIDILRSKEPQQYTQPEMEFFLSGMQLLRKLKSELNIFKEDNKIFKGKFVYNSADLYLGIDQQVENYQQFLESIKDLPLLEEHIKIQRQRTGELKASKNTQNSLLLEYQKLYEEDYTESVYLTQKLSVQGDDFILEDEIEMFQKFKNDDETEREKQQTPKVGKDSTKKNRDRYLKSEDYGSKLSQSVYKSQQSIQTRVAYVNNDQIQQESLNRKNLNIEVNSQQPVSFAQSQQVTNRVDNNTDKINGKRIIFETQSDNETVQDQKYE